MGVGAISGYAFQPYIYNTNTVSAKSLNKISAISDDLTSAKTDFTSLYSEEQNINPLKKGETANFAEIFEQQMQMSQMNASRILS